MPKALCFRRVPTNFSGSVEKQHGRETTTSSRRVHAPRQSAHRSVALSRRLSGRQFQFPAYEAIHPDAGAREVRRLLHGRSSGRAEHADRQPEAQSHRHIVRSADAVAGARRRHRTDRAGRDRLHHFRSALPCRAQIRLARSHQRRSRGMESRHHLQSRRRARISASTNTWSMANAIAARANSSMS